MEGKIMFWFDKEGDVLDISIGKPKKAVSKEVVGFTILNFTKRFENLKKAGKIDLPLKAKITSIN